MWALSARKTKIRNVVTLQMPSLLLLQLPELLRNLKNRRTGAREVPAPVMQRDYPVDQQCLPISARFGQIEVSPK